jgi:hypothetical protein
MSKRATALKGRFGDQLTEIMDGTQTYADAMPVFTVHNVSFARSLSVLNIHDNSAFVRNIKDIENKHTV